MQRMVVEWQKDVAEGVKKELEAKVLLLEQEVSTLQAHAGVMKSELGEAQSAALALKEAALRKYVRSWQETSITSVFNRWKEYRAIYMRGESGFKTAHTIPFHAEPTPYSQHPCPSSQSVRIR